MAEPQYPLSGEIWKPVPGYPGLQASSLGRIRTIDRYIEQSNNVRPGEMCHKLYRGTVLKPRLTPFGYHSVCVREGDKRTPRFVHRLVCTAFHGTQPDGCKVAHNDGTRINNRPDNLRWATPKENCADRVRHGTAGVRERNPRAKINSKQVDEIRRLFAGGMKQRDIAPLFGISKSQVHHVTSGQQWS